MNTGHASKNERSRESLPFAAEVYRGEAYEREAREVDALRAELRNEVRALRTLIARGPSPDLGRELAAIRAALDGIVPAPPKRGDRIATFLRARGIEGGAATRIAALARESQTTDSAGLMRLLASVISLEPWTEVSAERRVVALVGFSGVGKTTTAAKLAARARLQGQSVALVSGDGFRVGAVDQLERYADLMDASFHVARTSAELTEVLEAETADLVLVDTSGRAPAANTPEAALSSLRSSSTASVAVLLCMTAATRAADAARIVSTFAPLSLAGVCVTKVDETVAPGGLVHGAWAGKLPLTLIANGPRVPEDLTPADRRAVLAAFGAREEAT